MQSNQNGAEEPAEANTLPHRGLSKKSLAFLTIGAIGVVFGDIGTSPLYAFREALGQAGSDGLIREDIVGVLSLALWALILIVTIKYIAFLMRADNDGEGGVLALLALTRRGNAGTSRLLLVLGAVGAALFFGDAMLTPALSVLSAVEGLKTLPGVGSGISQQTIIFISLIILMALFAVQRRGTGAMSKLFGPICVVWFLAIGAIGAMHIADAPAILAAFLPWHAVNFLLTNGVLGLFVLGAVFLTVTGAEALTADMGHFGKMPIQLGWLVLVFPALSLNYLGQGAFALKTLEQAQLTGTTFANQDWFFQMIPVDVRLPMVLLATAATIIASQAVITGAYSLTQQAIQLGLLPRLNIKQTSAGHKGQIYIGSVNWMLLAGVVWLVVGFGSSSAMATAYGIAVTGTMVVTTCLAFAVTRLRWGWSLPLSLAVIAPFLAIDLLFLGANMMRVTEGGWVSLAIGALVLVVMWTWIRGRSYIRMLEADASIPLAEMVTSLAKRPPTMVDGVAVYLTARNELTPHALLHNIKHNHVLHRHNYVTTVRTLQRPHCDEAERLTIEPIDERFSRVTLNYGFMETPDVREALIAAGALIPEAAKASFFIGRNNYAFSSDVGMPMWQDVLFIALHRNAADPTDYFNIPPGRVIELGTQYTI